MSLRDLKILRGSFWGMAFSVALISVSGFLLVADTRTVSDIGIHVGLTPVGFLVCLGACFAGLLPGFVCAVIIHLLISKAVARGRAEQTTFRDS